MASTAADSPPIEANATDSRGKRPVWNVPSNGSIEVGPVMGAVSWPALSESAKISPKSSSDSLKALSESSGQLLSSPSVKPANSVVPTENPMAPVHPRPMKLPSNSGAEPALHQSVYTGTARTAPEPSPKGSTSGGLSLQPHSGGDQHRSFSGNRRGNNGGGPHQNHRNRRDQEWNRHRNPHMQQQRGGFWSYARPSPPAPPVSAPFIVPPMPIRPFGANTMGFPPDFASVYFVTPQSPHGGVPLVPHPVQHSMFFPALDPQLRAQLLKQIEYYFSSGNLCKDLYLRQHMDDQGWVHISLIAGFNKVRELTNNIPFILDAVRLSTLLEVQGEKIRRRNDWMNWLLLPSNHICSNSSPRSPTSTDYDAVVTHFQNIGLEEGAAAASTTTTTTTTTTTNHNMRGPIHAEVVLTRSASGNLNNQFRVVEEPRRDGGVRFSGFIDSDGSPSSRSLSRSDTL